MSELSEISKLVAWREELLQQQQNTETELGQINQKIKNLEEVEIPDAMLAVGLTKLVTDKGVEVKLEKYYGAKIKPEYSEAAHDWLEERGLSSMIKNDFLVSLDRGDHDKAQALAEKLNGTPYTRKESVHPSTLKAWVRTTIESGGEVPTDLFGVFIGNTIKTKHTT